MRMQRTAREIEVELALGPEEYHHVGEVQREAPPRRTKCEVALALSRYSMNEIWSAENHDKSSEGRQREYPHGVLRSR